MENEAAKTEDAPREAPAATHADFDPNVVIFACRH